MPVTPEVCGVACVQPGARSTTTSHHETPLHNRTLRRSALGLGAVLALGACSDAATAPASAPSLATAAAAPAGTQSLLAVTVVDRSGPALYLRDVAGTAFDTVHFDAVTNRIPGNYGRLLPVHDTTINVLGPVRWSPSGGELAVVTSVAFDQSEVVVMRADGHNKRVASVDGQIIMSDVDWSPDGGSIAYTMSTLPFARGVDLFVTDLRTMRVTRVTNGYGLGLSELRWDSKGGAVYFTQWTGDTGAEPYNRLSRVNIANVASGIVDVLAEGIVGDVQGISRDGTWALALRDALDARGGPTRELVLVPLARGVEERVLLVDPGLKYAELVEGDREAIVAGSTGGWYGSADTWTLAPLDGGAGARIAGLGPEVTSIAATRTAR